MSDDGGQPQQDPSEINSIDQTWWPTGYQDPAFQVRRQVYGPVMGGDYVRGSDWVLGVISGTVLPTSPQAGDTWILGTPFPAGLPAWQPPAYPDPVDLHPVIPPTVPATTGHAIRWTGIAWFNIGPTQDIAHTALRFPTEVEDQGEIVNKGLLRAYPIGHDTVGIQWGWPSAIYDTWLEVALVRSTFGRPSTVNDGVTIYRQDHAVFKTADYDMPDYSPPPVVDRGPTNYVKPQKPGLEVTPMGLPPGYWYYYGLFFRMNEVTWVKSMDAMCLLPRDHHHAEHLFDRTPPYYQWVDNNQREGEGFLRTFLKIFGYDLDLTREFVESWQKLYWNDFSPIQLLRRYGSNIGWEYESGLGDIRYRGMLSDLGFLLDRRGTKGALEEFIESTSKYECDTTFGENMLLLPDDSDFFTGTGNWGGLHTDTNKTPVVGAATILAYDKVIVMSHGYTGGTHAPPADYGREVMMLTTAPADALVNFVVACGDSQVLANDPVSGDPITKEAIPLLTGVPVHEGVGYGFSAQLRSAGVLTFTPGIMWFAKGGQPSDLLSTTTSPADSLVADTWTEVLVEGVAPEDAVYMVPYIYFTNRPALVAGAVLAQHIAGAMVFNLGATGNVTTVAPDRYLTMGDPGEVQGAALTYKGNLTGAATALPTVHAVNDMYILTPAPVPTAAPQYTGVSPARAAAANDAIYWNGTAWVNAGPTPSTFQPFLIGSPQT